MQAPGFLHTGSGWLLLKLSLTHTVTEPSKLQGDPSAAGPYHLLVLRASGSQAHLAGHGIFPKALGVAPPTPARHPLPRAMVSSSSDARLDENPERRPAAPLMTPATPPSAGAGLCQTCPAGLTVHRAGRRLPQPVPPAGRAGEGGPLRGSPPCKPRRPRRPSLTGPRLGLSGPSGRPLLGALQEQGRGPGRRDWSARELLASRTASCLSCHLRTPALGPWSRTSARPGRK